MVPLYTSAGLMRSRSYVRLSIREVLRWSLLGGFSPTRRSRALLCGDRLDEELPLLFGWNRYFGARQCVFDQGAYSGLVQRRSSMQQFGMTRYVSVTLEALLLVRQTPSPVKSKASPSAA